MHPFCRLDETHRRLFVIGSFALILGVTSWIFRACIPVNHDCLDAFCGFFFALNIALNLLWLPATRRCQGNLVSN